MKALILTEKMIEELCNKIVRHTRWYDKYWDGVQKFWYLNRFDLDVVNLGSNSGKYAFNYDNLNISGMNWAIGPQSLVHDFNVLKNYFSYLKPKAKVIITLCPFSSLISQYTKENNLKYYTFLHPATILDFDEEERLKALKIKQNPIKEIPWLCIRNTLKEGIKIVIHRSQLYNINMEESAVTFINAWKNQFGIDDLDAPISSVHHNEQYSRSTVLKEMIDFCICRDLSPIIVIPPVHPALAMKMSNKFRENYIYSFVNMSNVQNIPFYNYLDDNRFISDIYFRNAFFLSNEGAKHFTSIVLKDIGLL